MSASYRYRRLLLDEPDHIHLPALCHFQYGQAAPCAFVVLSKYMVRDSEPLSPEAMASRILIFPMFLWYNYLFCAKYKKTVKFVK